MLPTHKMVAAATAQLEKMYDCTFTYTTEVDNIDPLTGIVRKSTENHGPYPCRLSYKTSNIGDPSEISKFAMYTTLFCSPKVFIPKGVEVAVTGRNTKQLFRSSSISARYDTHQEIQLQNLEVR